MIISFTLKRSPEEEGTAEQKSSEEATDKTMDENESKPADNPDADKENTDQVQGQIPEDEDDEESSDSPTKNGEKEEKGALATHKDNKDVVLREDLKAVFGKFGDVKVLHKFSLVVQIQYLIETRVGSLLVMVMIYWLADIPFVLVDILSFHSIL